MSALRRQPVVQTGRAVGQGNCPAIATAFATFPHRPCRWRRRRAGRGAAGVRPVAVCARATGVLRAGIVAALAPLVVGGAAAAQTVDLPRCQVLPPELSAQLCLCTAESSPGPVWGSDPYTADSDICAAARHAGVIDATGGPVLALRLPGQDAYTASSRNGVTSESWGAFGGSLSFAAPADALRAAVPACQILGNGPVTQCTCAAMAGFGPVWGSNPYTGDSDLCAAARHAGVIGPDGGIVTVLRIAGLSSYAGSTAHGVTTADWGAFEVSFTFDRNARSPAAPRH